MLTVGSLFSGIGGLDLGLERAGMSVIWQSEIDPYCCKVLAKHWPSVPNLGDVTMIDWSTVERPDLICGGYPCQPFSSAGARRGEADPKHLWPYMLAAIRALRPRFAILENVAGHRSLGFGRVLGDLASSGYDTEWESIQAASVGAPHLRERVFVLAYPNPDCEPSGAVDEGETGWMVPDASSNELRQQPIILTLSIGSALARDDGPQGTVADPEGVTEREPSTLAVAVAGSGQARQVTSGGGWWSSEPDVGRVADGVPSRVDRLRGLGNAVVPQVAEFIGAQLLAAL